MVVNLILAVFWLLLAVVAGVYLVHPAGGRMALFGSDVSAGWVTALAGFMFAYNMLRWWLVKSRQREHAARQQILARTRHRPEERNPEFDFTEMPGKKDETA
jgi:hypothetical protein